MITFTSFVFSCIAVQLANAVVISPDRIKFTEADIKGELYIRPIGASKLHDPSVFMTSADGCNTEQVHITVGDDEGSIVITFSTWTYDASETQSTVYYSTDPTDLLPLTSTPTSKDVDTATGTTASYNTQMYISYELLYPSMGSQLETYARILKLANTANWAFDPKTKEHYANYKNVTSKNLPSLAETLMSYKNPYAIYDSPLIHTVTLTGLASQTTYYYRPKGSCTIFNFTSPFLYENPSDIAATAMPSPYPMMVGLTADLGQTEVSQASLAALSALKPDFVVLVGDLCYADGWGSLWDTFGRMIQSTFAHIPLLTSGGNHEMSSAEDWQPYNYRYPNPHSRYNSPSNTYWAREIGAVHIISLNSYAGAGTSSLQYGWLANHLKNNVNRLRTPWLIVMMHTPWYNSNSGHWKEATLMQSTVEPLLYKYGVDIILVGHVHAYERTQPVYNNTVDPCGPIHITIGDGGNYENAYTPWRSQEVWGAFREASFGVAGLELVNDTHAHYKWHRHACGSSSAAAKYQNFSDDCVTPGDNSAQKMLSSDITWLVRPSKARCPKHYVGTASADWTLAPSMQPVKSPPKKPTPGKSTPSKNSKVSANKPTQASALKKSLRN